MNAQALKQLERDERIVSLQHALSTLRDAAIHRDAAIVAGTSESYRATVASDYHNAILEADKMILVAQGWLR